MCWAWHGVDAASWDRHETDIKEAQRIESSKGGRNAEGGGLGLGLGFATEGPAEQSNEMLERAPVHLEASGGAHQRLAIGRLGFRLTTPRRGTTRIYICENAGRTIHVQSEAKQRDACTNMEQRHTFSSSWSSSAP